MSELTLPLQDIIKRAAQAPAEGKAAAVRKRFERASAEVLVLVDCSGSMLDYVGNAQMRKCDHLKIALRDVAQSFPKIRLIAFNSYVLKLDSPEALPAPMGGTDLAGALTFAAKWRPRKTIVISDGLPDSPAEAREAAESLTGAIDTIYCGPDSHPAIEFLHSLSRGTGGVHVAWDGYRGEIAGVIRGLLAPPK